MLLSETDGPVQYHGPFQGKATKPSFVIDVVQKLAELKSQPVEAVRDVIETNFHKLLADAARS
jgi:TatD DNase family protein